MIGADSLIRIRALRLVSPGLALVLAGSYEAELQKFLVPPFRSRDRQLDIDLDLQPRLRLSTLRIRLDAYHPTSYCRLPLNPRARLGRIPTCYIRLLCYPQDCGGCLKVAEALCGKRWNVLVIRCTAGTRRQSGGPRKAS